MNDIFFDIDCPLRMKLRMLTINGEKEREKKKNTE